MNVICSLADGERLNRCPLVNGEQLVGDGRRGGSLVETERFRFADVRGELVGRRVALRAYVSGESRVKAIFTRFRAVCTRCKTEKVFDAADDPKELYALLIRDPAGGGPVPDEADDDKNGCGGEGEAHSWVATPSADCPPLIYQTVLLRDSMETEAELSPSSGSSYGGYLLGRCPACKDVELEGTLVVNPRNDNIELLAETARPTSASVGSFELEPGEAERLRAYFSGYGSSPLKRLLKELAAKNNPRIAGREQAKLATMLAFVSPMWIDVSGGQLRAGTIRVMLFGDARQGKGSIADYLRQKLQLGKHAIGETSSRAGITYAIDSERGMVVWGVMVEADGGLVVLEALHKFPAEDLATMRETLAKLYVEVRRSYSARAWARTRVVADSNARQEMDLYPYACMALKDLPCFKDQADVTRWDLPIPFKAGEVDADSIAEATLHEKDDQEFLGNFRELVLWVWSRKPDRVRFTPGAIEEARTAYRDLLPRYSVPDVPVVNEDSLLSILRLSAAFAGLTFSSPDGLLLEVKEAHVKLAREFFEEVLEMLEVEDYKVLRGELSVTQEDRREYSAFIRRSELASKVMEGLARGPRNSTDLSEETGHEAPSIRRVCVELKAVGAVERVSAGYRLTKKGIQLWREFHVTRVTEVTEKGTPPSGERTGGRRQEQRDTLPAAAKKNRSVTLLVGDGFPRPGRANAGAVPSPTDEEGAAEQRGGS